MSAILTMREAAAEAGLSYERFRKVWRELCKAGFPSPFRARCWDAEAVSAWRKARSQSGVAVLAARPEPVPKAAADGRKARAALQMLRAG